MNDRKVLAGRALLTLLGALVIIGAGVVVYAVSHMGSTSPLPVADATPAVSQGAHAGEAPSPSPSSPSPATSPALLPLLKAGPYRGRRPSSITFSADGGNIVFGLTWSSWTPTSASGTGSSSIENCVPNCAQGGSLTVPATIRLSKPVDGAFTVMTEIRDGDKSVWHYPRVWPFAAQGQQKK